MIKIELVSIEEVPYTNMEWQGHHPVINSGVGSTSIPNELPYASPIIDINGNRYTIPRYASRKFHFRPNATTICLIVLKYDVLDNTMYSIQDIINNILNENDYDIKSLRDILQFYSL